MDNTAWDQLRMGWIGVFVAFIAPFDTPLLLAPLVIAGVAWWVGWLAVARIVGVITIRAMLYYRIFALAAWLANPILVFAWLSFYLGAYKRSLVLGGMALGFILSFLTLGEVPFGMKNASVPILTYGAGYWLWVSSAASMVVIAGAFWRRYPALVPGMSRSG